MSKADPEKRTVQTQVAPKVRAVVLSCGHFRHRVKRSQARPLLVFVSQFFCPNAPIYRRDRLQNDTGLQKQLQPRESAYFSHTSHDRDIRIYSLQSTDLASDDHLILLLTFEGRPYLAPCRLIRWDHLHASDSSPLLMRTSFFCLAYVHD